METPVANGLSRRGFLRSVAATGALTGAAVVLEACGAVAPAPSTGSGGTAAGAGAKAGGPYPTYIAPQGGPKPDFPSSGPPYEDGFMYFPSNPKASWTKPAPGAGGTVQALVVVTRPAVPTPEDQNPAWQQINKALNVDFQLNRPSAADYAAKLATIMAGNDLPDIICFRNGLTGTPNLPTFLEQSMADLTPYLGGDAAKDYPNLAALPTQTYKNLGCAYNGKLYMVPAVNSSLGSGFFRNVGIYDQEIGPNYTPRNADDFKRVLQALTRPSESRWAIGTYQGTAFDITAWASVFGAPNNWQLDTASGKLTKNFETQPYKDAVAYVRDLYAAGVYHPDSLSTTDNAAEGSAFTAAKFVIIWEGYAGTWQQQWLRGSVATPPQNYQPLSPFPAHDGGKPSHYPNAGASVGTGLKKSSPDRIKELLRVLDWLAAPFGSQEDLLLTFGAADADWKPDTNGHPTPTDRSNADSAGVNWKNIVVHPSVAYAVGLPDFAKATVDAEHQQFPLIVNDPTLGLVSTTDSGKGVPLNLSFLANLTDIIVGRRPLTDYDQIVKEWQSGGGETIRQEYQKAIAAAAAKA